MADDGVLSRRVVQSYVFPVYARTIEEAGAPAGPGGRLSEAFDVVEVSTAPVSNPYLDRWRADADAARYARDYVAFVRGFAESSLLIGLFHHAGGDTGEQDRLLDEYFRRLQLRLKPTRSATRSGTGRSQCC